MKNFLIFLFLLISATCQAEEIYVNRVWYFGGNQFYIYLNYNEGYDWKSHDEIKDNLGEPRTTAFESTRRSVPMEIAKKYFNMPWKNELWLFNNKSYSKIGLLSFEGVEYYEDMITSSYVAVFNIIDFQAPTSLAGIDYFCISSNSSSNLITLKPKEINSDLFKNELQSKYGFNDQMQLRISSIANNGATLTLCSFYDENYNSNSVLMESSQGNTTILNEILQDEYVMWDLMLTPLIYNDKPVLIMEMGIPETDNNWTQVGIFNGSKYTLQSPDKMVKIE